MAEVSFDDLLDNATAEVVAPHAASGATSSLLTSSSSPRIGVIPGSTLPAPLQVLHLLLSEQLLVAVETTTGYVYEGTLSQVDEQYNLTLCDVTVSRRRIPRVDFGMHNNDDVSSRRGRHVGYLPQALVRGNQIMFVELPESLQVPFVSMAKAVKREARAKEKMKIEKAKSVSKSGSESKTDGSGDAHDVLASAASRTALSTVMKESSGRDGRGGRGRGGAGGGGGRGRSSGHHSGGDTHKPNNRTAKKVLYRAPKSSSS